MPMELAISRMRIERMGKLWICRYVRLVLGFGGIGVEKGLGTNTRYVPRYLLLCKFLTPLLV